MKKVGEMVGYKKKVSQSFERFGIFVIGGSHDKDTDGVYP